MIASAHLAAGFVAGMTAARVTTNTKARVALAFGLGFLSHIALDAIPHGDYLTLPQSTIRWIVLGEILGIFAVAGHIIRDRVQTGWPWYLTAGVIGAGLPDMKFGAKVLLSRHAAEVVERYGDHFHSYFHAARMAHPMLGLRNEIVATVLLLAVLYAFPRQRERVRPDSRPGGSA